VTLTVRPARREDAALVHRFIVELADYQKLAHEVKATPEMLAAQLFGDRPMAEAVIGEIDGTAQGFALFFHNFSTFEARPGIYLEDLYVSPEARGSGLGQALLAHLARLAVARACVRLEWFVLDWNTLALGFYHRLGARPLSGSTLQRLDGAALAALAAI
jgi:GNAT superfamily N-acetyltransferase